MFGMKKKSDAWINKHRLHIFDWSLTCMGLLLSIPPLYLLHLYLSSRVSAKAEVVILFVVAGFSSSLLAQLIGQWIYRQPAESWVRKINSKL